MIYNFTYFCAEPAAKQPGLEELKAIEVIAPVTYPTDPTFPPTVTLNNPFINKKFKTNLKSNQNKT
jgi:hypothetical protein